MTDYRELYCQKCTGRFAVNQKYLHTANTVGFSISCPYCQTGWNSNSIPKDSPTINWENITNSVWWFAWGEQSVERQRKTICEPCNISDCELCPDC